MTGTVDFLIAGSGFGGCLLGLILDRLGFSVLVVDSTGHPRFAVGESSTPLADATLYELCQRYGLPSLAPLTTYGSAKRELPQLTIGLKRGFSCFGQRAPQPFSSHDGRLEQLIVAASLSDEVSDTHWLRSDVDSYFASQVRSASIPLWEYAKIESVSRGGQRWDVAIRVHEQPPQAIRCKFLIDASGRSGALVRQLSPSAPMSHANDQGASDLMTNSRAIYEHFTEVTPWSTLLTRWGIAADRHPFPCHQAAVHHLIDNGWMWQLPFDNGLTSVGFVLHTPSHRSLEFLSPQQQFNILLERYPSLTEQFRYAKCVAPGSGLQATQRLQYRRTPAAGSGWACLPAAVGFVDPLHSTGIAHTLAAIQRLSRIFESSASHPETLDQALAQYAQQIDQEFSLIDQLVVACYRTLHDFDAFVAATMLYFAAATYCEQTTLPGMRADTSPEVGTCFLNADHAAFRQCIGQALEMIEDCRCGQRRWGDFPNAIRDLIAPFNLVGLCDPHRQNVYPHTAPPKPRDIGNSKWTSTP